MLWLDCFIVIMTVYILRVSNGENFNDIPDASPCYDTPESQNDCSSPTLKTMYYFDVTTWSCKSFMSGNCQKTKNVFQTFDQCERLCNDGLYNCKYPRTIGCDTTSKTPYQTRWWYNSTSQQCTSFQFISGCTANSNNYLSQPLCTRICIPNCADTLVVGGCNDIAELRWAYNGVTGDCYEFIWKGCTSNSNNFQTYRHCMISCARISPCPVLTCAKDCPYGYEIDNVTKCETCTCYDPCNPNPCATTKQCIVYKQMCDLNTCMYYNRPIYKCEDLCVGNRVFDVCTKFPEACDPSCDAQQKSCNLYTGCLPRCHCPMDSPFINVQNSQCVNSAECAAAVNMLRDEPKAVFYCAFEDVTLCGLVQAQGDGGDFYRNSGRGPHWPFSGPGSSLGNTGYYLLMNGQLVLHNSDVQIVTPMLNIYAGCLSVWYLLYGEDVGTVQVYKFFGDGSKKFVWSDGKIGATGMNVWLHATVSLSAEYQTFRILITATQGSSTFESITSDIAIDDLYISDQDCKTAGLANKRMKVTSTAIAHYIVTGHCVLTIMFGYIVG